MKIQELQNIAQAISLEVQKQRGEVEISLDDNGNGYIELGDCSFYFENWSVTETRISF